MSKLFLRRICLFFLAALFLAPAHAQAPLEFIRNAGQWDGPFAYKARSGNTTVFVSPNSFTYLLEGSDNGERMDAYHHGELKDKPLMDFFAYRVSFLGANPDPVLTASKEQPHYYNYFLGNDPARWKNNIHPAYVVDYSELYPGIDLHLSSERGQMKYDFLVRPGADPSSIRLAFEGADGLRLKNGNLVVQTSLGEVTELKPVAYQYSNGERRAVPCSYRINGSTVSLDLPKGYDKTTLLIIDPTIVFATFTGSVADNWGFTATYDAAGNFYAGGLVNSTGYPVTLGAFQGTFGGGHYDLNDPTHGVGYPSDIGISKFNPTGTSLIYATYIGGADNETPHSMIVDGDNNLIIAGRTYSSNFPVTSGAFDETKNAGADIVLVKLNAAGSQLVGSTYLGGSQDDGVNGSPLEHVSGNLKYNYGDDARSEVLIDRQGNIYVTASTLSADFPVTSNAFQSSLAGGQDAVYVKMNPTLTTLVYATYLGGTADDAGYVLALDTGQQHVYVGGGTMSNNFPSAGSGVWKPSYQGGHSDGYIAKFQNSGAYALDRITFIGTANLDQVYGLQTDLENNVYAMGQSVGGQFPVTSGVYNNSNSCQFVVKLPSNLSTNTYSTVFGSGDPTHTNISPVAFLVDTCQNVYISGWGGNLGYGNSYPPSVGSCTGMPISTPPQPGQQTTTDGSDFYFIVLSKNAISLLYSTFYGRFSTVPFHGEHVDGGTSRFDANGIVYQAICGNCGGPGSPPLPTTPGSYSPTVQSNNCNLLALKIAFELGAVKAVADVTPNAKGCPPFTVQFQNNSSNATGYEWDFDDGATSTDPTPSHTFLTPGVYHVKFVAINPNACRVRDSTYLTIIVDTNAITPAFTATVTDSCGPYVAAVTNTSQLSNTPGAANFTQFQWLWGDGQSSGGATPGPHTYADTGYYTITLVMEDSTACNSPDTVRQTIHISSFKVAAGFDAPDSLCLDGTVAFVNTSTNGANYFWDFGDGQTSTEESPIHTYDTTGVFTVQLIVEHPGACNFRDTLVRTVVIRGKPLAAFSYAPTIPIANEPISFTNQSTGASSYIWSFGDGSGSIEVNPVHLYRQSGFWEVCLIARNNTGCADTVCKLVQSDIVPLADIPTAFSPNGDGQNDILFVRGGAIERIDLKIFNRWGELVFETVDPNKGWDGTYKGRAQEMDAYAYVLNVWFIDGSTVKKQGNVTLLR